MKALYRGKNVTIDKVQRIRPDQAGSGRKKFQVYTIVNKKVKKIKEDGYFIMQFLQM